MPPTRLGLGLALAVLAAPAACRREAPVPAPSASVSTASSASAPAPSAQPPASAAAPAVDTQQYVWLERGPEPRPVAVTTLGASVPTPPGSTRVTVEPGSFAAWLRNLPLAAPGTAVVDWRGETVFAAEHEHVQAVVAIDVGKSDLQQSADVILRLHAEWRFASGHRDHVYLAATKDPLSYTSHCEGKRILAQGGHLYWVKQRPPNEPHDYASFRDFLDTVFTWVNSTAVRMQSEAVKPAELRPGDFFLQKGKPGHALVVLDVAEKGGGQRLALLGQALTQAMSIHVLRLGRGTAWFRLDPNEPVLTPNMTEYAWSDLRRLVVQQPAPAK